MYLTLTIVLVTIALLLSLKLLYWRWVNWLIVGETPTEAPRTSTVNVSNSSFLLDSLPTGVFTVTEQMTITYVNPTLAEELGRSITEIVNKKINEVFVLSYELEEILNNTDSQQISSLDVSQAQVQYRDADGQEVKSRVIVNRFQDRYPQQYICLVPTKVHRTISEERHRRTQRLRALGELASGLAHEINNSLTGVVGFTNLLLESEDSLPYREELEIIQQNAQQCKKIIENTLGYVQTEGAESEVLDVNAIINNSLNLMQRELDIHNIQVMKTLDPELPSVAASRTQLEEVLVNLLNNARNELEAVDKQNRIIRVKTQPRPDERIQVSIDDSGNGVPENLREKIFEPFFTTKSSDEGTGLGLFVVEGIVTDLGGDITVEDSDLGGARFNVTLPAGRGSSKALEGQKTKEEPHRSLPKSVGTIMVVEDEESIRQLFERVMDQYELEGKIFETPLQGIEFLDHVNPDFNPDVIFLDLVFPGNLRGQDLVEWLESFRNELLERVILITGNPNDEQTKLVNRHDGIKLLTKPLHVPDLIQTMSE